MRKINSTTLFHLMAMLWYHMKRNLDFQAESLQTITHNNDNDFL